MTGQVNLHPLEVLRRLFGAQAAEDFRTAFSGTRLFIPEKMTAEHRVAKAIGMAHATALSSELGGMSFDIPTAKFTVFRARLEAAVAEGLSNREIAARLGVTERHVYGQRQRYGIRQRDLPPPPPLAPYAGAEPSKNTPSKDRK
jgi:hypothetical protein